MKANDLIIRLASLQASILINQNAYDDDLEFTWESMKEDYENLKTAMDKYIQKGEKNGNN